MILKDVMYSHNIYRIGGEWVKGANGKAKKQPVLYLIPFGRGKKNYLNSDIAIKMANIICKQKPEEFDVYYVRTSTQKKITTFEICKDGSETAVIVFRKKDRKAVRKMIADLSYRYPNNDFYGRVKK